MMVAGRIDVLVARCAVDLGRPDLWFEPDSYYGSLAMCIVEAIQSTRSHYTSVQRVIRRYTEYRGEQEANAKADNATDLIRTFDELGGPDHWADRVGNRKPTSTNANAPLKATAILEAARALAELDLATAEQLRQADDALLERAQDVWNAVPGQRSGLTWSYLLMLAGVRGFASDHLVSRYLARALQISENDLSADGIVVLVDNVALRTGQNPQCLGNTIWRFESRRPVNRQASVN